MIIPGIIIWAQSVLIWCKRRSLFEGDCSHVMYTDRMPRLLNARDGWKEIMRNLKQEEPEYLWLMCPFVSGEETFVDMLLACPHGSQISICSRQPSLESIQRVLLGAFVGSSLQFRTAFDEARIASMGLPHVFSMGFSLGRMAEQHFRVNGDWTRGSASMYRPAETFHFKMVTLQDANAGSNCSVVWGSWNLTEQHLNAEQAVNKDLFDEFSCNIQAFQDKYWNAASPIKIWTSSSEDLTNWVKSELDRLQERRQEAGGRRERAQCSRVAVVHEARRELEARREVARRGGDDH